MRSPLEFKLQLAPKGTLKRELECAKKIAILRDIRARSTLHEAVLARLIENIETVKRA